MARNRIRIELSKFNKNPPTNIGFGPVNDDDYLHYEGIILGAKDTPYEGGIFLLDIIFPYYYPYNPPKIKFKT